MSAKLLDEFSGGSDISVKEMISQQKEDDLLPLFYTII